MIKKISIIAMMLAMVLVSTQSIKANELKYDLQYNETSQTIVSEIFELLKTNHAKSEAEKIDIISSYFLDTPYVADRMVGSNDMKEELVIDLEGLDCFTYLDYLEAFRRSTNEAEFIQNLEKVRYIDGQVDYLKRKHFYSDWYTENTVIATDLLTKDGQYKDIVATDVVGLNDNGKGGSYIPNLETRERDINYVPRDGITVEFLKTLQNGDYIGLRREIAGLDVTHTGLIIQKEDGTYMRHASSSKSTRKVVDQLLTDYLGINTGVKGVLFFRPNAQFQDLTRTITVNYLDKDNNVINKKTVMDTFVNEGYELEALKIEGYILVSSPDSLNGMLENENLEFTFVYEKVKVDAPVLEEAPTTPTKPSNTQTNDKANVLPNVGIYDSVTPLALTYIAVGFILIKNRKRTIKES